jgi:hypothetical protein
MNSPKIIYLNSTVPFNQDPGLLSFVQQYPQIDWDSVSNSSEIIKGHEFSLCARIGKQTFPFKNNIVDCIDLEAPLFDPKFDQSFSSVTDRRCIELLKEKSDRPWLLMWSGGIDSTTVLTSVLKNTTAEDRKNIQVVCNAVSVYENPRFFFNHVEKNFKLIDTADMYQNRNRATFENYYVVTGEFADNLSIGRGLGLIHQDPNIGLKDCVRDPDQLLGMMSSAAGKKCAHWYYERMIENIQSTDLPISTYFDACWWQFFNYVWTEFNIDRYFRFVNQFTCSSENFKLYNSSMIDWYNTKEYQKWSMHNILVKKNYGNNIANIKQYAKEYIYEFDRDEYYRVFKMKGASVSWARETMSDPKPFCYLDDFTWLGLDRDLDQILNLLPDYLNL